MAPNQPYSTVGGYGGNASLVQTPSGASAFVDDAMDGFPTLVGGLTATGQLSPIVIDPSAPTYAPYLGMPEINAILIELRVIAALLHFQLGSTLLDLQQMRADEAWATNINTGVL